MDPHRMTIGLPILAAMAYFFAGWCLTITNPETLISDLETRHNIATVSKPRFVALTVWTLLRRCATWPAWYR